MVDHDTCNFICHSLNWFWYFSFNLYRAAFINTLVTITSQGHFFPLSDGGTTLVPLQSDPVAPNLINPLSAFPAGSVAGMLSHSELRTDLTESPSQGFSTSVILRFASALWPLLTPVTSLPLANPLWVITTPSDHEALVSFCMQAEPALQLVSTSPLLQLQILPCPHFTWPAGETSPLCSLQSPAPRDTGRFSSYSCTSWCWEMIPRASKPTSVVQTLLND